MITEIQNAVCDVVCDRCTVPGLHGPSVHRIYPRNPWLRLFGTSAAPRLPRSCAPRHPGEKNIHTSCNVE